MSACGTYGANSETQTCLSNGLFNGTYSLSSPPSASTRTMYTALTSGCGTYGAGSETQTCQSSGLFNGTYSLASPPSASTRTMYQSSSVTCGNTCTNESQSCLSNGSWSGTYGYGSCSVTNCVSAPTALSTGAIAAPGETTRNEGKPIISGSISSATGDGYYVVRCDADGTSNCILVATGTGTGTFYQSANGLKCPAQYTLFFYSYNNDASLGGATDASCTNGIKTKLPSLDVSNKLCSTATNKTADIKYCTQGFFGN